MRKYAVLIQGREGAIAVVEEAGCICQVEDGLLKHYNGKGETIPVEQVYSS